jgi:adenylate cyclase
MRKRIFRGVLTGTVSVLLALAVWLPGLLDTFEAKTWDARVKLLAKPGEQTENIVLILLDQESLDWAEETMGWGWPWPRQVYSAIIEFVQMGGAKSLAFDVLFSEPSILGVYDDEIFGASIAASNRFIAAAFFSNISGQNTRWPEGQTPYDVDIENLDNWLEEDADKPPLFRRASFPVPEIAGSVKALVNVHMDPDPDAIYRRGNLFSIFNNTVVPSVALASYLIGDPGEHALTINRGKLVIDGKVTPIDKNGASIIRFRGPSGTHTLFRTAEVIRSYIQIMEGEEPALDPEIFKDTYVLYGFSAPGLKDLRPTPVSGEYPGVEVHATMLDNLLSGDFMRMSPSWFTFLLLILFSLGASVMVSMISGAVKNGIAYGIFLPLPVVLSLFAYQAGFWLPLVVLEVGAIIALIGASLLNYATEGKQKRYIKGAFSQYLSPTVIERLIADPEQLKLGGEKRELSIFFSDLQGFTTISEGLTPEELTTLLNEYLSAMTDIIQEEGGTIDKYEGDAIIAFWNAPVKYDDHAIRLVRASLRCQDKLAELRPVFKERIGKEMLMRIGMNTGPAVVGNMGSKTRFDYTMLGDAVNLAARLEGINKQFGTYTMISRNTLDAIGDAFPVRELSRVAVVGRKEAVVVYEPFTPEGYDKARDFLRPFDNGLQAFYKGEFRKASEFFAETAKRDPAAGAYLRKCRSLTEKPPENWQGVWVMTEK